MVGIECVLVVAYINRFDQTATAPRITSIVLGGGVFVVCSIYWFRTVARRSARTPNAAAAVGGGVAVLCLPVFQSAGVDAKLVLLGGACGLLGAFVIALLLSFRRVGAAQAVRYWRTHRPG
jgi:hypothetical protein